MWLLERGVASYEEIEKACVYDAGHIVEPFRSTDLTGIDLAYDIDMSHFYESNTRKANIAGRPVRLLHCKK